MTIERFGTGALRACGFAVAMFSVGHASADAVEDFYKGKTISIVIGYPAGAGYDVASRLLAAHIAEYIPGRPNILAQNMPGAGSLIAMNHIYNVAPKDGTIIGSVNRSLAMAPLLESDSAQKARYKFDAMTLNWIGSLEKAVSLGICKDSTGFSSFSQFREKQMIQTASAPNSDSQIFPTVFNNMLGTKIKVIGGRQGTGENLLAMERGEADCYLGTSYSSIAGTKPDWLRPDDPYMNVVVQIALEKHPKLPQVPLVTEFASGDELAALELLLAPQIMGRPYFTTPGVPADRVAALRKAFEQMMDNSNFIANAERIGIEVGLMSGKDIESLLAKLYRTDAKVVKLLEKAMPEVK